MTDDLRTFLDQQAKAIEDGVRLALAACGGDPMDALRAAIVANTFLMEENDRLRAQISAGYARGRIKQVK